MRRSGVAVVAVVQWGWSWRDQDGVGGARACPDLWVRMRCKLLFVFVLGEFEFIFSICELPFDRDGGKETGESSAEGKEGGEVASKFYFLHAECVKGRPP